MVSFELTVYIQPNARETQISGKHGKHVKIRMTAPPVEGQANKALINFLATELKMKSSLIKLVRGHRSRIKTVRVGRVEHRINKKNELMKWARFLKE